MSSVLLAHTNSNIVTEDQLERIKAPSRTKTWFPVPHIEVLRTVRELITNAGYKIDRQQLAVMRDKQTRFFGTLDLTTRITTGVTLSVGIRNSTDRSFPLGFAAGQRVFVCDNLAFSAELIVKRKHTRFGQSRFEEAIANAVRTLDSFKTEEAGRIDLMRASPLSPYHADSLILRAYESGIVSVRHLPDVIREWRSPSHEDFEPRTSWSLFNSFTSALREMVQTNPSGFAKKTIELEALLTQAV